MIVQKQVIYVSRIINMIKVKFAVKIKLTPKLSNCNIISVSEPTTAFLQQVLEIVPPPSEADTEPIELDTDQPRC